MNPNNYNAPMPCWKYQTFYFTYVIHGIMKKQLANTKRPGDFTFINNNCKKKKTKRKEKQWIKKYNVITYLSIIYPTYKM